MGKRDALGRQLRSQLDNRVMGSGVFLTETERENTWDTSDDKFWDRRTNYVHVTLPNDEKDSKKFNKMCQEMSGEVKVYKLAEVK